jgi:predicted ArsR family transcriptional regulator
MAHLDGGRMNAFELHASRATSPLPRNRAPDGAKQITRVLEEMKNGPATSRDISDETGLSVKHTSAYLSELREAGLVEITGLSQTGLRGRPSNVYELSQ